MAEIFLTEADTDGFLQVLHEGLLPTPSFVD
jgi:hypothetical protein